MTKTFYLDSKNLVPQWKRIYAESDEEARLRFEKYYPEYDILYRDSEDGEEGLFKTIMERNR